MRAFLPDSHPLAIISESCGDWRAGTRLAVIGLVILLAAGAAGFFVLKKKKDAEPEKEDPDADFNEDLGDEFNIEQEFLGDEDFDDMDEMWSSCGGIGCRST